MYKVRGTHLANFLDFIPIGVCLLKTEEVMLTVRGITLVRREPPIVSLIVDKRGIALSALKKGKLFSLIILSHAQERLAASLLGVDGMQKRKKRPHDYYKDYEELLSDKRSVATIECKKIDAGRVEDQVMLLGEVLRTLVNPTKAPVVYYDKKLVGLD